MTTTHALFSIFGPTWFLQMVCPSPVLIPTALSQLPAFEPIPYPTLTSSPDELKQ